MNHHVLKKNTGEDDHALNTIHDQISGGLNSKRGPGPAPCWWLLTSSKLWTQSPVPSSCPKSSTSPSSTRFKRFLGIYLRSRQNKVEFRNSTSSAHMMKHGVTQGSSLSPLCFNLHLNHISAPLEGINLVSYADDCNILATGYKPKSNRSAYLNTSFSGGLAFATYCYHGRCQRPSCSPGPKRYRGHST